jgi:hypothetical protein
MSRQNVVIVCTSQNPERNRGKQPNSALEPDRANGAALTKSPSRKIKVVLARM